MKIPVSIIVAIDEKRGIGKDNQLLFKISEDLKRFREITKGHAVIMGRKTYESIISYNGKPLPGRLNIVLSRDPNKTVKGEMDVPLSFRDNWKQALEEAEKWENAYFLEDTREIFIIGGAQIFTIALEENLVDKIYLTKVDDDYHADAFFPDYEKFGFTNVIEQKQKESDGYQYSFVTLAK
ncbi:MAG TPA: dihydrofolate reductase [Candidatus Acidoferrales bacterium]|nr:dihydrofolate reductase [Candidatus Acidoferrales bacterium]